LMRDAFRFAAETAPDAELYYNDFNAWRPEKVAGIVRMVGMLKAHGIRIDGVGIQGHWGLNYPALADIEAAIDAYHAAGVKVMVTELDVDVLPLTKEGQVIGQGMMHPQFQLPEFKRFLDPYRDGLPDEVQRQLADRYAELFALFHRKRDRLARVAVWGVADDMSWKNTAATCPSSPCACSMPRGAQCPMPMPACDSASTAPRNWWPPTTAIRATLPLFLRPNAMPSAAWPWPSCAACPAAAGLRA